MLVELLTAVLSAAAMLIAVDLIDAALLLAIVAVLVVIVVYDLRHLIIPDELVIILTGLALARLGYFAFVYDTAFTTIGFTILGAFGASAFFALVWYGTRGRGLGFGDVKLAAPLALLVGHASVFSMVVLSFWIGAVVSVGMLLLGKVMRSGWGKTILPIRLPTLTMKSAVPFAPFLVAGALAVLYTHVDILALFVW
jgi:leader peptidase (prepilin peptidase)/N-methyltransferase